MSLKDTIKKETVNELNAVAMDVTNSFLRSEICSPIMSAGFATWQNALSVNSSVNSSLESAGIYVSKDGIKVDIDRYKNVAEMLVTDSVNAVVAETQYLLENSTRRLLQLPPTSIITSYVTTYFNNWIQSDEYKDLLILDLSDTNTADKKNDEANDKEAEESQSKLSYFITNKLPEISNKVTYVTSYVSNYAMMVSEYAAFGPQWVINKTDQYVSMAQQEAEKYVNLALDKVDEIKTKVYESIGKLVTTAIIEAYKKILERKKRSIEMKAQQLKTQAEIKASVATQKANAQIQKLTGKNIDISKLFNMQNLTEIKRTSKLASLLSKAMG